MGAFLVRRLLQGALVVFVAATATFLLLHLAPGDPIGATLDVLERSKFSDPPTIGEIAVACAISYVEFRIPDLDWKPSRPQLAAWYDRFCEFPSMKATVPAQP